MGRVRGQMTEIEDREEIHLLIVEAIVSGARKHKACEIIGITVRSYQRWKKDARADRRKLNKRKPGNALGYEERELIKTTCCKTEYMNLTPNEIVPLLAEKGLYIGSESTMYRILKNAEMLAHRSQTRVPTKNKKPVELKATGPNQVWSWDITYLMTMIRGQYYFLYLFMDVWSRLIVGWEIHSSESAENSAALISRIMTDRNVSCVALHADNGGPMKGATMLATLQRLHVVPSFSRPHVSDDNPYSESLFKTLKYHTSYPKHFESIEDAQQWVGVFVEWYNNKHQHSGIQYVTPSQRHSGDDIEILKIRKETYRLAKLKHPERWTGEAKSWERVGEVTLNPSYRDKLPTAA
jgi:transposase InsO family protein